MRTVALGVLLAGTGLVLGIGTMESTTPSLQAPASVSLAVAPEALLVGDHNAIPVATLTQVVQQYCVVCHNDQLMTGNLSLQGLDVDKASEKAQTAERMIRKLRAGMMPPPGIPRPGGDTLLALVET